MILYWSSLSIAHYQNFYNILFWSSLSIIPTKIFFIKNFYNTYYSFSFSN
nr:MAG TPA_asm: hypothetical protein [Caudoviricetes sp.]